MFLLAVIFPLKSNYREITRKMLGNRLLKAIDYMMTAFAYKAKPDEVIYRSIDATLG